MQRMYARGGGGQCLFPEDSFRAERYGTANRQRRLYISQEALHRVVLVLRRALPEECARAWPELLRAVGVADPNLEAMVRRARNGGKE